MSLISVLFGSKFLKSSVMVMVVNLIFYRHVSLFGKGGLVVDLIVINVSLMLHDLISYFLLDYEFLLKKIRNLKLVKIVEEVGCFWLFWLCLVFGCCDFIFFLIRFFCFLCFILHYMFCDKKAKKAKKA